MSKKSGGGRLEDLVADFIAETREGLDAIEDQLERFRLRPDDRAALDEIRDVVHAIGETCRFLGLSRLQALAYPTDAVLAALQDGRLPSGDRAGAAVLDAVARIRDLAAALCDTGDEPDGDDGALIARLEALLAGAPEPAARASEQSRPATQATPQATPTGEPQALRRRLDRMFRPRAGPAPAGRRLLLIDPTPFARAMLQPLLARAGYGVVVARDPRAALALHDAGEQFDMILADTGDRAVARRLAAALGKAVSWHAIPLLSLAPQDVGTARATPEAPVRRRAAP